MALGTSTDVTSTFVKQKFSGVAYLIITTIIGNDNGDRERIEVKIIDSATISWS